MFNNKLSSIFFYKLLFIDCFFVALFLTTREIIIVVDKSNRNDLICNPPLVHIPHKIDGYY
jgi:hypothetical protein